MRLFDLKLSFLLVCLALPFLFLPKINLLSLSADETAGLRLDDVGLLIIGVLFLWAKKQSKESLRAPEQAILAITALGLFSFLINQLLYPLGWIAISAKGLYSLRLLEYFLFFYVGSLFYSLGRLKPLVLVFFAWNLLFMILQKLGLIGAISSFGYVSEASSRVQGIASFPSEMGLLLNLMFCYFIFDESRSHRPSSFFRSPFANELKETLFLYVTFCFFALFIIFTGNRISIAALLFCFAWRLKEEWQLRPGSSVLSWLVLLPIATALFIFALTETIGVYKRSAQLLSTKNLELFSIVWEGIDIQENPIGNEKLESSQYDMSWFLRVHKWLFMAKSYLTHPECYLQGLGPGYAGSALDGGFLRILTEYGLLGLLFFYRFFRSLATLNAQIKWMVIAFGFNMIFFDAYLAYKTMSLLLFCSGYVAAENQARCLHPQIADCFQSTDVLEVS